MDITAGIEPIADPRTENLDPDAEKIHQKLWGLNARVQAGITFEEYVYWAKIERAEELETNREYVADRGPLTVAKVVKGRFSKGIHHDNKKKKKDQRALQDLTEGSAAYEKGNHDVTATRRSSVSDEEWKQAARALRTTSWGTIFYLITTDILGWGSTP
jgi:hypothetical protein